MEDGSSMPLWGLFVLLLLLWLNGIFYGFAAALRNISENDTQKKAEEGDKKAQMLMTLIDKPAQFVNAIPLIVMACGICFGTFLVPYAVDAFYPYIKHVPALILVMALCVIFLAAIGILVAILNQLLVRSGREEQAMMTSLAGLIVVLMIIVQEISKLFEMIKSLFGF